MAALRGKGVEGKPLPELQELAAFYTQVLEQLSSTIAARNEEERRAAQERWLCKVWLEREMSTVLQPCNYAVVCGQCTSTVACYPVCRAEVTSKVMMMVG